jgi:hypothetical protein
MLNIILGKHKNIKIILFGEVIGGYQIKYNEASDYLTSLLRNSYFLTIDIFLFVFINFLE